MTRLAASLPILALSAPAFAHMDGTPHLHGSEAALWVGAFALAALAVAVAVAIRGRR